MRVISSLQRGFFGSSALSTPQFYVGPTALGSGTGIDKANRASHAGLNAVIPAARAAGGKIVYVDGTYTAAAAILSQGGLDEANPMVIETESLHGVEFVGARGPTGAPASWSPNPDESVVTQGVGAWNHGSVLFQLNAGANHLYFKGFKARHVHSFIYVRANILNLQADDIDIVDSRYGLVCDPVSITKGRFRRWDMCGFSKSGMRFRADSSDIHIIGKPGGSVIDSHRQADDAFAMGLQFDENARDVLIQDYITKNCHDNAGGPTAFWNGDGIVAESGNRNFVLRRVKSYGHTDASFDLKADNVLFEDCEAFGSRSLFKVWRGSHTFIRPRTGPVFYRNTGTKTGYHFEMNSVTGDPIVCEIREPYIREDSTLAGARILVPGGAGGVINLHGPYDIEKGGATLVTYVNGASAANTTLTWSPAWP